MTWNLIERCEQALAMGRSVGWMADHLGVNLAFIRDVQARMDEAAASDDVARDCKLAATPEILGVACPQTTLTGRNTRDNDRRKTARDGADNTGPGLASDLSRAEGRLV